MTTNTKLIKRPMLGGKTSLVPKMEHSINDYFKFKADKTDFGDIQQAARTAPLTNRIHAQRQLKVNIEALEEKRISKAKRKKELSEDWEISKEKQLELRQFFMHFNSFIKENYDKRKRAESKIQKEKDVQKKLLSEINKIKKKIEICQSTEKELNENVKEFALYKDFLLKAANQTDKFADIKEIINRHDILGNVRHSLGEQQANALEVVQKTRQTLTNSAECFDHTIMILQTQLAALRERKEAARSLASKWDSALTCVRSFSAEKAIQVQQVENACWDLYKTMCQLQKEPIFYHQDDTESQLVFISKRIKKVKQIYEIARNKKEKHEPPSIGQTASTSIHIT